MPRKCIAIVQSSYIPWKGYFDLINGVDEFVLFDDAQYTRRDWRNRNLIKTAQGPAWLTIPVQVKGRYVEPVKAIEISDPSWTTTHWRTLRANYARAPFFRQHADAIEQVYRDCASETRLSAVNHRFLVALCRILGIDTRLSWSMDYSLVPTPTRKLRASGAPVEGKTERLVEICRQAGAETYLSGPRARAYIEPERFRDAGVQLAYFDYCGYPEYPQLFPPFDHRLSVLDLIFNVGPDAPRHMLTF